jgi:hypothetical protein
VMLYLAAAPLVLAKALVSAPWDPYGVWTLALLGTIGLTGAVLSTFWNIHPPAVIPTAVVATSIIAFGLASPSPLAALGAVPLLLAAALWPVLRALSSVRPYALLLAGLLSAVWLLSQGALDLRYNLIGVALLPALAILALLAASASDKASGHSRSATVAALVAAILLALAAIYPQALIEWVARPAVSAMAGGVGVPSALVRDWGVGLLIRSPDETILAALPATGMALAVFLAWLPLYWLKRLARNAKRETRNVR